MKSIAASTSLADSTAAGQALAEQIRAALPHDVHAVIVFAAPNFYHEELLTALQTGCSPEIIVGASSAGEFTNDSLGSGLATALAIHDPESVFRLGIGRGLQINAAGAATDIVKAFAGPTDHRFKYRSALVLTDALAGYANDLTDALTLETGGEYQFFGGGAGDNASFERTTVFAGTEVLADAAVALEILSNKPLGIGVSHGWDPASPPYRVTESDGLKLISLNGMPAFDAFQFHAEQAGQQIDRSSPIPFFLQNIIGIDTGDGYRLRVPLGVHADGSVQCAAEVPTGSVVRIMRSSHASAADAAERATQAAISAVGDGTPRAALFFDCVATRLRCGDHFATEVDAVTNLLGDASLVGCNTHGQIARAEGQFEGFHNCTAVVCVFAD